MFIFKKLFSYNKNIDIKEKKENLKKIDNDSKKEDKKDDYTQDPYFFT